MNAEAAFDLEARVMAARQVERRGWVLLAEQLHAFHSSKAWQLLGWERFSDWLGWPEVGISRRTAYRLLQAWDFANDFRVPREALELLDLTKLAVVIPRVKAGSVEVQDALSDVEMLSRSDLIEKYGGAPQKRSQTEECPTCGLQREKAA